MSGESATWLRNDGGRADAGFKGQAGDCVTRAIAIAAELDYREVYDELYRLGLAWADRKMLTRRARRILAEDGGSSEADVWREVRRRMSPRLGSPPRVYKPYILSLGFDWTPTMQIGSGCRVHLRSDELPAGRLIARCSGHLVAVIDGTVHDTGDPSRGGTRCVYGYWSKVAGQEARA